MSDGESKQFPPAPGAAPEVEGSGKPERKPRPMSRPDPGAVQPVDPQPLDPRAVKPDSGQRKRHRRVTQPLTGPERALSKEAEEQARQLKRKHRVLYAADPRRFRRIVRVAQSTVFRQKPGPKPDRKAARLIAHAARKRARGAKWTELYQQYVPSYQDLNPVTRAYAEDGFRRKVSKYRQIHRRLGEVG